MSDRMQIIAKLARELEHELSEAKALTRDDRELLEDLSRDIDRLARYSPSDAHLLQRLRDATKRFEVSHPDLTAVTAKIMDTLTRMGI